MAEAFSLEALIFSVILISYVLTSRLIESKKVPYLHESTVAIVMGMLTAGFARYVLHKEIQFSHEVFFALILPLIIFSAGYSLRKSLFFENLAIISFLGIFGTILGFICLTGMLLLVNLLFDALTLKETLMLSSVLCATDTLAAMSLVKATKYPVLNAVLFGEGILNDAVAIILLGTVSTLDLNGEGVYFYWSLLVDTWMNFCYLFFFSLTLGLVFGFGLSYVFKLSTFLSNHPIQETSLILLNGYLTYLIGELMGLSGILALFTCALIMGHYSFMNISTESQRGTGLAFQTVSYVAEAFVFAYLGASIFSIHSNIKAVCMAIVIILCLPIVRAIMVYSMPLFYRLVGRHFPLSDKQIKFCWFSGMVRGVIAFALCLQIKTDNTNTITTIASVVVLVTSFAGSTFIKSFASRIGMVDHAEGPNQEQMSVMVPMHTKNDVTVVTDRFEMHGMMSDSIPDTQPKHFKKIVQLENRYIRPIMHSSENDLENPANSEAIPGSEVV